MPRPLRFLLVPVLGLTFGVLAASCGKNAEQVATPAPTTIAVASVDLGRGIGVDRRVTDATDTFKPNDVIYASILTRGASENAMLKVKWTFEDGQVVDQSERSIAPTGEATTEFHISKADGWPAGKYKLEVFLNETPAEVREFEVKVG